MMKKYAPSILYKSPDDMQSTTKALKLNQKVLCVSRRTSGSNLKLEMLIATFEDLNCTSHCEMTWVCVSFSEK